jgi:hypothetical protein
MRRSPKTLIFLSSRLQIPPELEKAVTVLDMPLPSRPELDAFLNELEAEHPGMKNVLLRSALDVTSKLSKAQRADDVMAHRTTVSCTKCGKPSSKGVCGVCRMTEIVWQHSKYTGK